MLKIVLSFAALLAFSDAFSCKVAEGATKEGDLVDKDCSDSSHDNCFLPDNSLADNEFMNYGCGPCPSGLDAAKQKCKACTTGADNCNVWEAPNYEWKCWTITAGAYAEEDCTGATKQCYWVEADTANSVEAAAGCGDGAGIDNAKTCETFAPLCNRMKVEAYECFTFDIDNDMAASVVSCDNEYEMSCFGPNKTLDDTAKASLDDVTKAGGCGKCVEADTSKCVSCSEPKCNGALQFVPFLAIILAIAFWLN